MKQVAVHLKAKEDQPIQVDPMPAHEVLERLGARALDRVVAVKIDGELADLSTLIDSEAELEPADRELFIRLCSPDSAQFIVDRPDYYAFYTYSLFTGWA